MSTTDAAPLARRPATTVSERAGLGPLLGWVGFSVLLFYVILVGGSWLGLYVGWTRLLDLGIVTVGLGTWLVVAWRRPDWRPTTAIWPAFAAGLGAMGLSLAFSPFRRLGIDYLAWAVLLVALYLLFVRIMALPYVRARIGGLLAAMALVLGVAYVAWTVALWLDWWDLVGNLRLPPFRPAHLGMTWGSPSVLVAVQVLMVAAAAGGLGFATRGARLTIGGLVVLTGVIALISGSRSAWLALGGAIVIVGALLLVSSQAALRTRARHALRERWVQVGVVVAIVVLAGVAVLIGPSMIDRFGSYGDGGRPDYWVTALRMIADAPLLGLGPGTWMVRRVAYAEPGELDLYQPHAHDQYLQTGAELGLVGLAAGLVAFACVGWLVVRAIRGADPRRRSWAWASAFGLTYLAFDVVVDVHTIPTVALLMAIPIAALDATSDRGIGLPRPLSAVGPRLRILAIAALAVGCLVAIGVLARSESISMSSQRAVAAIDEEDWASALAPAHEAAAADPDYGVYQVALGLAALGTGDWQTAEEAYTAATAIDDAPASWLGLAVAQAELGRSTETVDGSLRETLRMGDQQAAITFGAGQVYDRIGMTEAADSAYATTLGLLPSLAADEAWQAALGPERSSRIVDGAISSDPGSAWEIALMNGDPDRARSIAGGQGDPALAAAVIDAWGGDAEAAAAVRAAVDASPEDPDILAWAARLAARAGDMDGSDRYRRLIRLGPHYGPVPADVRVSQGLDDREDNLGISTFFYGPYLYRRASPVDILPPTLAGLVEVGVPEAAP